MSLSESDNEAVFDFDCEDDVSMMDCYVMMPLHEVFKHQATLKKVLRRLSRSVEAGTLPSEQQAKLREAETKFIKEMEKFDAIIDSCHTYSNEEVLADGVKVPRAAIAAQQIACSSSSSLPDPPEAAGPWHPPFPWTEMLGHIEMLKARENAKKDKDSKDKKKAKKSKK